MKIARPVRRGADGKVLRATGVTRRRPTLPITYLVSQGAPEASVETSTIIVHLPQYVQLEEDFKGMARILEALQDMYDLPGSLIDYQKGEAQYQEITRAVASNPRLGPVIKQLEVSYDDRASEGPREQPPAPLSPEVEKFLENLDFESK